MTAAPVGSYAFVGETAPASVEPPGFFARAKGLLGKAALALGLFAAVAGSFILGSLTTPFHYVDALVVVAVAILPALAVLASFFVRDRGVPVALVSGGLKGMIRTLSFVVIFAVLLPGNLVLYANERLDTSPAVVETVPVTDTWSRTSRSGRRTYFAGVTTDVGSPLGRLSFYGAQPIAIPRNDWTTLLPGRTRLVLREHRGFFRLPWFEPNPARAR